MLASFLIQVISLLSLVNRLKSHSHSAISLGNNVYVKDILVLNLDRKEEKYNVISKALDKLAVTHTRYSALSGHFTRESQSHKFHPKTLYEGSWSAQIAHWQTYIQVYFNISDRVRLHGDRDDPVLILEDDSILTSDSLKLIETAGQELPADWEVFVLGYKNDQCLATGYASDHICRVKKFLNAHAYIVRNATVADKLLQFGNTKEPQILETWWLNYFESVFYFYMIRPSSVVNKLVNFDRKAQFSMSTPTPIRAESQRRLSLGKHGYIKDILVLNLDRRIERYYLMEDMFKNYSLSSTRYPAVDGKIPREQQLYKFHPKTVYSGLLNGETSCWQTHLQAYFNISERVRTFNEPDLPVMILEDDARFPPDIEAVLKTAGNDLPDDWEFFVVGYKNDYCMENEFATENVCRVKMYLDTHAYIVRNATAAEKVIQYGNVYTRETADTWWLKHFLSGLFHFYLIRPKSVVCQLKVLGSDIQSEESLAVSSKGCECCG